MPSGKPKEWRWVANDDDDFDDSRGSDSHSHTAMGTEWWQDGGWDSQTWNDGNGWNQTSEWWADSAWQASKDDSMQWSANATDVAAQDDSMSMQQQQWPMMGEQKWPWTGEQQQWTGPWAMAAGATPPLPSGPPGNWSHESRNKITMEEAIQWAEEETEQHEKAMRDGEEMAEVQVCLNAATAKAKAASK